MSYQTPPQFSGAPMQQPSQEIDWGVISEGFNLLFKNWQVYVIPGVIMLVIYLPAFVIGYLPLFLSIMNNQQADPFATIGLLYGMLGLATLITIFLYPGIVDVTIKLAQGRPASEGDLWIGFKDPLGYFAVSFIAGLVTVVGVFACCIGVFVTAGLMMFALPIKVATGVTATEAVTQSWNMLKKDWLMVAAFYFVVQLISQIGTYACYVGFALTMPFLYIAPTLLYCRFMGIQAPRPQYDSASPYPRGGSYGQQIGQEQPRPPEQPPQPPTPEQ